jgi:ketosteroid isomerase-like protein
MASVVASLLLTAMLSGCAGLGGPSPEEEVQAVLETFHASQIAGDIDAMMAVISDDYSNSQGATKTVLQGFLSAAASQGFFKDMTVDMANSEMVIDGDSASVAPVIYNTPLGALTLSYELRKEADGSWRFTSTEQSN